MRYILLILLLFVFFSWKSKEQKLFIGYSPLHKVQNIHSHGAFIFVIAAEDKKQAAEIYLRDRQDKLIELKDWQVDVMQETGQNYTMIEITNDIIHKK